MADCRNCGEYATYFELNDNDGLCDDCNLLDASCSVCNDDLSLGDLNEDGVCFSCLDDDSDNSSCEHCGDAKGLSEFDGLCEWCASQGY